MSALTPARLRKDNVTFAGTGGVSQRNRSGGFLPAFYDAESGSVEVARFRDGAPAPLHLLEGLPEAWVKQRRPSGQVMAVKDSIVAGFLRRGRFYTREQAARAMAVLAARRCADSVRPPADAR